MPKSKHGNESQLKSGGYGNREGKRRETFQRKDERDVSKAEFRALANYLTQISQGGEEGGKPPDCPPPEVR